MVQRVEGEGVVSVVEVGAPVFSRVEDPNAIVGSVVVSETGVEEEVGCLRVEHELVVIG